MAIIAEEKYTTAHVRPEVLNVRSLPTYDNIIRNVEKQFDFLYLRPKNKKKYTERIENLIVLQLERACFHASGRSVRVYCEHVYNLYLHAREKRNRRSEGSRGLFEYIM